MKMLHNIILSAVLLAALICFPAAGQATTTNYPETAPGIQVIVLPVQGTYSATVTPVRWTTPFKMRMIGVSASVRDVSGTVTVDVKEAGASILSAAISCPSANVTYEGTVSDIYIADEAAVTIVLTISGTNPHATDVTVVMTVRRMN